MRQTRGFTERHSFYDALSDYLTKFKCHGPILVVGDVNARLHKVRSGKEGISRPHVFGIFLSSDDPLSNRNLLMVLCERHCLKVVNTYFDYDLERRVTYREWGVMPMDTELTYRKFV